jgi:large subunit ribosomal protein LP2
MKHLAAYLLLQLGGNASPSAKDITEVLESVGIEADAARLKTLLAELKDKDINTLISEGSSKLASVPSGGSGGGAAATGGAAAGGAAAEEEKVEEKEEEKEVRYSSHEHVWLLTETGVGRRHGFRSLRLSGLKDCMYWRWISLGQDNVTESFLNHLLISSGCHNSQR